MEISYQVQKIMMAINSGRKLSMIELRYVFCQVHLISSDPNFAQKSGMVLLSGKGLQLATRQGKRVQTFGGGVWFRNTMSTYIIKRALTCRNNGKHRFGKSHNFYKMKCGETR